MSGNDLLVLEEMGRLAQAERLAEAESARLAQHARRHGPKGRPIRARLADALRALASRLDREVMAPQPAGRGLARIV